MRTIAHVSDLHFGRIDSDVVEGLLADLWKAQPSLVVISGDLVQRAMHSHFQAARTFLERLIQPYLVVPGNHDIPCYNLVARFTHPFRRYQHYITKDLSPLHVDEEMAVLGINTARSLNLNFAHGRINHRQIQRIHDVFGALPHARFKVVVTHHPFLPPPDAPSTRLIGRARMALPALEACHVDLLLAGHLHRGYTGDVCDHHAHIERTILVAQASTATSTRTRNEPNGYNFITIDPPHVTFQERVWDGNAFVEELRRRYVKSLHGWEPD
ncbi:MAG: metallophosphoesterase [Azospirillum sp.]|nr:metallophosphoesterase [Azospirillum sp.]